MNKGSKNHSKTQLRAIDLYSRTNLFSADKSQPVSLEPLSEDPLELSNTWNWTAPYSQKSDRASAVHITNDNNIFITGVYGAWDKNDGDIFLAKLDMSSAMIWIRKFDANKSWDFGSDIAEATNGDVLIAGAARTSNSEEANHHGWVLRVDKYGNVIWSKIFGGNPTFYYAFSSIAAMPDGGAILLGISHPGNGWDACIWLVRISSDGTVIWQKHIKPDFMTNHGSLNTNNLIVDDESIVFSANFGDSWILKYSLDGSLIWRRSFVQPGLSSINGIAKDHSGNIFAAGHVFDNATNISSGWIFKTNKNGGMLWERLYTRVESLNLMHSLCIDGEKNIWVAGTSGKMYMGEANGWLLLLDDEGVKKQEEIINYSLEDKLFCIARSSSGCLIGAGSTTEIENGKTKIWVHRFT